jgi:hypothetical protein
MTNETAIQLMDELDINTPEEARQWQNDIADLTFNFVLKSDEIQTTEKKKVERLYLVWQLAGKLG